MVIGVFFAWVMLALSQCLIALSAQDWVSMPPLAVIANLLHLGYTSTVLLSQRLQACGQFWQLISLACLIGWLDGYTQRQIRRYQGARESTRLFHQTQRWIPTAALTLPMIYWALPINIPAHWVMLPTSMALGVMIAMNTRYFKKYR